jgi:hypothetical protein
MAVGRSRKQMERIKKARRAKNTDRFVVTRTRSGMIVGDVLKKSAGRSVPKTRAHTRSVPATKVSRENGRQPRPKVPLLPGGKDSTLGERFEGELYHP